MSVNATREDESNSKVSRRQTLFRLYRYLFCYKKTILFVLFTMIICIGITLLNPILLEHAINVEIAEHDVPGLIKICILSLVLIIILTLLIRVRMYIMAKLSNDVLVTIRQELYSHIQTLSFQFFDSRPTGKILARIMGDVNSLKDVLSNSVTTLIPDFLTLIATMLIMFIKNYQLALAALSSFPFMVIGTIYVQTKAHKGWQLFRKKGSNLNAYIHENMAGIKIVQSFAAEKETQDEFDHLLTEHRNSYIHAIRYADAFGPIVDFCWGIASLCLFYTGVKLAQIGEIEVGTIIAFGMYISMFWRPLLNLSNFYNQLVTNMAGAERIFEILDTKPDLTNQLDATDLPPIQGDVQFDHVSFEYDENSKVLEDISFHITPGQTIALVGPTGAGKTTIVNLISRFYDIQKGHILIDGYDISKISIESLRQQMGIMTQENFLFTGTILYNIGYGNPDATKEQIIEAAKAVNAHDFIMNLEHGYETELKDRGAGLSNGQKQLLAFARTMVSNPRILILDEATSSIDTNTEILVQQGIQSLLKGRTSFVIAHRLSTILKADQIFYIDQKKIMEQGTASELLEKKGAFYDLYMAQFKNIT